MQSEVSGYEDAFRRLFAFVLLGTLVAASTGHHYESELDAKIRKIKEKNDQIMRRKQQIEEDKKKYG